MRRSRISRNTEKKTKNTLILSIVGIIVVLFLLFKFGIGLLVSFSVFLSGSNDQGQSGNTNQITFVTSPTLNPVSSATNSAHIVITGKSSKDMTIHLYLNNQEIDEIDTKKDGSFVFEESLKTGENQIKARAVYKEKKSDFSNVLFVTLKNSSPSLDISSPSDGQSFKKDQNSVNITGKTDSGVNITVNGFWAVIDDANNFSYILPLQNGDNEIKVLAVDQAGNRTEKSIKVNYSQ